LKKKFFVQYRDRRTIVIEQLFPIFFIFVGFALGTIKVFRDGAPRILSPTIFPSPNPLYYNSQTIAGITDLSTIVGNYFSTGNASEWSTPNPVTVDIPTTDLVDVVGNYDDQLFKIRPNL
jgi:hypothetical protein